MQTRQRERARHKISNSGLLVARSENYSWLVERQISRMKITF